MTIQEALQSTITARALRELQEHPMAEYSGASLAEVLGAPKASSVVSALAKGYESCRDGWQFVHRTEKRRPALYWFDAANVRGTEAEGPMTPPLPMFTWLGDLDELRDMPLLRREYDGRIFIAKPLQIEMVNS